VLRRRNDDGVTLISAALIMVIIIIILNSDDNCHSYPELLCRTRSNDTSVNALTVKAPSSFQIMKFDRIVNTHRLTESHFYHVDLSTFKMTVVTSDRPPLASSGCLLARRAHMTSLARSMRYSNSS